MIGIFTSRLRQKQPVTPIVRDWESVDAFKNLPVEVLITWCDDFMVFLDADFEVDYKTATPAADKRVAEKECGKVLSRIAVLQAVPIAHLACDTKLAFRKMLGESLARCLYEDNANAKSLLDSANQFISARNQETGRRWLVSASAIATFLSLAIASWLWLKRDTYTALWGEFFSPLVIACSAGATGALFSILRRVAKIPLDPAAGLLLHVVEGFGHIVAGVIGAAFVYLAMKCGVFAPKLLDAGLVGQALACMVGGASERLVPSIIKKVDIAKADRMADDDNQHGGR